MNDLMHLAGKRVLVVGAGRSGMAAARLAAARGALVTLTDARDEAKLDAAVLAALPAEIKRELGGHKRESFLASDLIVLSPGVPPTIAELLAARQAGVAVTGEVELAAHFIAAPIVAITGTNGKSTVTTLCGAIAQASGRPTFVGGNLGMPLSEAVGTNAAMQQGIVVVELSSFQLETCEQFHPRSAVVLNITPDHLDRYASLADYGDAKLRIARNLDVHDALVINCDDSEVAGALGRSRPRGRQFGYSTRPGQLAEGVIDGDVLELHLGGNAERYPTADMALVGRHNLGNALAAFLALRAVDLVTPQHVLDGARAFRPLSHRMELVGEHRGVRYYNDSKGTNVAAVVASLDGFPSPFVLIAGGRDKGGSYAPLREMLQCNKTRGLVLIGEAADRMAASLEGAALIQRARSLEEAVELAAAIAQVGDAVVLSPACSSYDMFHNYEQRGRVFCQAVEKLG